MKRDNLAIFPIIVSVDGYYFRTIKFEICIVNLLEVARETDFLIWLLCGANE
jgi:hypothetical protein